MAEADCRESTSIKVPIVSRETSPEWCGRNPTKIRQKLAKRKPCSPLNRIRKIPQLDELNQEMKVYWIRIRGWKNTPCFLFSETHAGMNFIVRPQDRLRIRVALR